MNPSDPIVCKPTPWFLFRAVVMFLMFGVFAVYFYYDGSVGYRKKNLVYFVHESFKTANDQYSKMNSDGGLTPAQWKMHAEKQTVQFPKDASILPVDLKQPMIWPVHLHDAEKMKSLGWNNLWLEYSKEMGYPSSPSEHPYDAGKIREQFVVFWICLALALIAGFFLIRTLGRKIVADGEGITTVHGRRVPYADLKVLDLRKWETKGLAYLDYDGTSGKGRFRIDGLTYGGFKKEQDEPAEQLMRLIRSKFSGEIIEYAPVAGTSPSEGGSATS